MSLILTDTFTKSLEKLDGAEQKQVKISVFDFQQNPDQTGASFHRIDRARDENMWSVRVNRDLRMIVHHSGQDHVLCYVDHHDEAYDWAERHEFRKHSVTGAMQMVEVEERVEERVQEIRSQEEAPVFEPYSTDYLLQLGVPERWLEPVHTVGESDLMDVLEKLPPEAAERLLQLYDGEPVPVPAVSGDGFAHPDASRRFRLVDSQAELRQALEYPWERWIVFLHPRQREVVERDYSGPALVTGSAGTGKSVVAMHRAARLLRINPEARVLLTSFSRTLAARLEQHMQHLLGDALSDERLEIQNLHALAARIVEESGQRFKPVRSHHLKQALEHAADRAGLTDFTPRFLRSEWEAIVEPWGIDSWEAYRDVSRTGRGTPLGARQRYALWTAFEDVRRQLQDQNRMTWSQLCYRAAELLDTADERPFDHAIADECQDLGPAELRLLRALVPEGPNDLFLCGDAGQQIYRRPFSWLSAGIDIRGRATRLSVNYRTTEQIRRFADRLLPGTARQPDGEDVSRSSVSLLNGPPPDVFGAATSSEEAEFLAEWLDDLLSSGFQPNDIAVFGRTKRVLEERAEPALRRVGRSAHRLSDDDPPSESLVSIGTMHRAKGLEFRAVAVLGAEDDLLPLSHALRSVGDEGDRDEILAKERQLLYVACTRAQQRLLVSWCGQPSAFLDGVVEPTERHSG